MWTRAWPNVVPVVRSALIGRSEIVHSVLSHSNSQIVGHSTQPWGLFVTAQQSRQGTFAGMPVALSSDLHRAHIHKPFSLPITTSAINFAEDLKLSENDHAHQVMRSLPAYTCSTVELGDIESLLPPLDVMNSPPPLPHTNWNLITPQGIAGSFIALSRECKVRKININSSDHKALCKSLCTSVSHLTDEQIKDVLAALTLWSISPSLNAPNFVTVWNALDEECVKRIRKWDVHQAFVVAELWFALGLSRLGCYTKALLAQWSHNISTMEPHHLVQYLFFMNLSREQPRLSYTVLEKRLCELVNTLTLEELGVIAMGLFKAKAFIKSNELTEAFFNRLLTSDISGVSSISLGSIFKILRRCPQVSHLDKLYKLLCSLVPCISELSLQAQLQVALLGNDTLVFKPELISQIAVNFAEQSSELRLKDIERMALVLMMYNYIPAERPDILLEFADELRKDIRGKEIGQYPKSFMSCVNYMATMGHLPLDLVSTALKPDLVQSLKNDTYMDVGREILELDVILDVDAPSNYSGSRLEPEMRELLMATYFDKCRLPSEAFNDPRLPPTHNERFILDLEHMVSTLLGGCDKITTAYVIPYTSSSADIVFCTNSDKEPVAIPEEYLSLAPRSIKKPLKICPKTREPLHWVALVPAGRNSVIRGSYRPRGQLEMKMRHLRKLGYEVVMVPILSYQKRSKRSKLRALDHWLLKANVLLEDEERVLAANQTLSAISDAKLSAKESEAELGFAR